MVNEIENVKRKLRALADALGGLEMAQPVDCCRADPGPLHVANPHQLLAALGLPNVFCSWRQAEGAILIEIFKRLEDEPSPPVMAGGDFVVDSDYITIRGVRVSYPMRLDLLIEEVGSPSGRLCK